ncbi:MFS transporter [Oricola sp.]|uniref:MFS transporter n=1 Tax=Oricola sp. TaxID=1979950 RepID=UPI003BABBB2F
MANTAAPPPAKPGNGSAVIFILLTVVINMLGVGLAWPVLPKLVQTMGGGSVAEAAAAYAVIATAFAVMQFAFSPLVGMLSDRFGRRPVLLISLAGLGVDYMLTAFAPDLIWLAAARIVGGIFGATATTANAAMADISSPETRARNFGYIGAAFGLGFILGPLVGGALGSVDIRLPFFAAAAMATFNVLFGLVFLPETLKREHRRTIVRSEANPFRAVRRIAAFPAILPLLIALFVTAIGQRGLESNWVLYADFRFGWDIRAAAWSLAFVGIASFAVQGFLVGPAVRRLGEWTAVFCGFAVSAVALGLFVFADSGWLAYPLIGLHILGNGIANPTLVAICSQSVDETRQGQLQGVLNAVNALAVVIGPFAAALVLWEVARPMPVLNFPGAWFALSAVFYIIAACLAYRHRARQSP